ncbi:MAG: hypothetical protein K6G00_05760 [Treponema sp.]|nr:hypothetical protein [Treponema sp.]
MTITPLELNSIIELVTRKTGILPRESHKMGIKNYVEKYLEQNAFTFSSYYSLISTSDLEFSALINESTVNETYFFREEKHFLLLKNKVFPDWIMKNGAKPIRIWSAACSYGEEPYSLALLTELCKINAEIYASDINTRALRNCKNGKFRSASKRMGDGEIFHPLFTGYQQSDGYYIFPEEIRKKINILQLNLAELDKEILMVPKRINIIFIRNVFIYFSLELRAKILKFITDTCLEPGGYIFVSMNEIAQIDSTIMPSNLEKIAENNIFCFHKKN